MAASRKKPSTRRPSGSNDVRSDDEADILENVDAQVDDSGDMFVSEDQLRELGAADAASLRENKRLQTIANKQRGGEKNVPFNTTDPIVIYDTLLRTWAPNSIDIPVKRLTGTQVQHVILSRPRSGADLYEALKTLHGPNGEAEYQVDFIDSSRKVYRGKGRITMPDARPQPQGGPMPPQYPPPYGWPPPYSQQPQYPQHPQYPQPYSQPPQQYPWGGAPAATTTQASASHVAQPEQPPQPSSQQPQQPTQTPQATPAAQQPPPQPPMPPIFMPPPGPDPMDMMQRTFQMFQEMQRHQAQSHQQQPSAPMPPMPPMNHTDPGAMMGWFQQMFELVRGMTPQQPTPQNPMASVMPPFEAPKGTMWVPGLGFAPISKLAEIFGATEERHRSMPPRGPHRPMGYMGRGYDASTPSYPTPQYPPPREKTTAEAFRESITVIKTAVDAYKELGSLIPQQQQPQLPQYQPPPVVSDGDDSPVHVVDTGGTKLAFDKKDGTLRKWESSLMNLERVLEWGSKQYERIQRQSQETAQENKRRLPPGYAEVDENFKPPPGYRAQQVDPSQVPWQDADQELPDPPSDLPPPINQPEATRTWGMPTIPDRD